MPYTNLHFVGEKARIAWLGYCHNRAGFISASNARAIAEAIDVSQVDHVFLRLPIAMSGFHPSAFDTGNASVSVLVLGTTASLRYEVIFTHTRSMQRSAGHASELIATAREAFKRTLHHGESPNWMQRDPAPSPPCSAPPAGSASAAAARPVRLVTLGVGLSNRRAVRIGSAYQCSSLPDYVGEYDECAGECSDPEPWSLLSEAEVRAEMTSPAGEVLRRAMQAAADQPHSLHQTVDESSDMRIIEPLIENGIIGRSSNERSASASTVLTGQTGAMQNTNGRKEWSSEEDVIIMAEVARVGQKWRVITAKLPGRTDDAVRNRWQRLTTATAHRRRAAIANSRRRRRRPLSVRAP
jgi:hypothetical protein